MKRQAARDNRAGARQFLVGEGTQKDAADVVRDNDADKRRRDKETQTRVARVVDQNRTQVGEAIGEARDVFEAPLEQPLPIQDQETPVNQQSLQVKDRTPGLEDSQGQASPRAQSPSAGQGEVGESERINTQSTAQRRSKQKKKQSTPAVVVATEPVLDTRERHDGGHSLRRRVPLSRKRQEG